MVPTVPNVMNRAALPALHLAPCRTQRNGKIMYVVHNKKKQISDEKKKKNKNHIFSALIKFVLSEPIWPCSSGLEFYLLLTYFWLIQGA